MRIAIFGTGGAGGYFGAHLARAGEEVIFLARGEHLRAIREHGLHIERGEAGFVVRSEATDDPTQVGEVDAVLVGVKAWQVTDAARAMLPMIGPHTVAVPLQNGVDAAAQLISVLGANHVLGGLCGTISRVVSPGHILSIGETNFIKFGELDNRLSERVERLRKTFEQASVKVEVPPDIEVAVWEKFIFVTPYGGVGALASVLGVERLVYPVQAGKMPALPGVHETHECPNQAGKMPAVPGAVPGVGVIRSSKETRSMVERGMEEILAVGRARKIVLADSIIEKTMALLDSLDANATSSLQRDISAGKPSELDAWTGAVVRLGKDTGVATPVNEFIYHSLLPAELSAQERLPEPPAITGG